MKEEVDRDLEEAQLAEEYEKCVKHVMVLAMKNRKHEKAREILSLFNLKEFYAGSWLLIFQRVAFDCYVKG